MNDDQTAADDRVSDASVIPEPDELIPYSETPQRTLHLHAFRGAGAGPHPAIVFFFGGGWVGGNPQQFYPHAAHLAAHGISVYCAEYRVQSVDDTPPTACVDDGMTAMAWLHAHAAEEGLDPQRIGAGGGSAGGHVAAATACCAGFAVPATVRPAILLLFNPVYDNSPDGYGHERVGDYWQQISPLHNMTAAIAPSIVFLGDQDPLIPVVTAEAWRDQSLALGSDSELHVYAGQPHGFFNHGRSPGNAIYHDTIAKLDAFLAKHGWY